MIPSSIYPGVALPGCRLVRQPPHPWQAANHHGRFATTPKSRGGCFPARRTRLLGVPPTSDLAGRSGCYTLSADFHQPPAALRALGGLRSNPSPEGGGWRRLRPFLAWCRTRLSRFRQKLHYQWSGRNDRRLTQDEVRVRWFRCLLSAEIPHSVAVRVPATWLFLRVCVAAPFALCRIPVGRASNPCLPARITQCPKALLETTLHVLTGCVGMDPAP